MGCACKGGAAAKMSDYVVFVAGVQQPERHSSAAGARIWIANNVKGKAATIRTVPKIK